MLKSIGRLAHPIASTALYLAMGWLVLLVIEPLLLKVPAWEFSGSSPEVCRTPSAWLFSWRNGYGTATSYGTSSSSRERRAHFNAVLWYSG